MKEAKPPVLTRLLEAMAAHGWRRKAGRLEKGRISYVVHCDVVTQSWERLLRGALSDAILTTRASGAAGTPLIVLIAPSVSRATEERLRSHVDRVANGTAWIIADERGRVFPHAPGLEFLTTLRTEGRSPEWSGTPMAPKATTNLFTDTHQWLLKVLLAPLFPERLLRAPRALIRNASVLAEVAEVSVPAAARFVSLLDAQGHLDRSHGDLRLTRTIALLERWKMAVSKEPRDLGMRSLRGELSDSDVQAFVGHANRAAELTGEPRPLVIGLFGACDALGLGVVRGAPRHVYLLPVSSLAVTDPLTPAQHGERVDLYLRMPRWPETVRRGALEDSGVAVTDVLQCWLDVSQHAARGVEQAAHLWRHAILPALGEP